MEARWCLNPFDRQYAMNGQIVSMNVRGCDGYNVYSCLCSAASLDMAELLTAKIVNVCIAFARATRHISGSVAHGVFMRLWRACVADSFAHLGAVGRTHIHFSRCKTHRCFDVGRHFKAL